MQKITSKFIFENEYQDSENRTQKASVVLDIDYQRGGYNITPYGGDVFSFKATSHKWKMWKAVLKSINEAIDFANRELGIDDKTEEVRPVSESDLINYFLIDARLHKLAMREFGVDGWGGLMFHPQFFYVESTKTVELKIETDDGFERKSLKIEEVVKKLNDERTT